MRTSLSPQTTYYTVPMATVFRRIHFTTVNNGVCVCDFSPSFYWKRPYQPSLGVSAQKCGFSDFISVGWENEGVRQTPSPSPPKMCGSKRIRRQKGEETEGYNTFTLSKMLFIFSLYWTQGHRNANNSGYIIIQFNIHWSNWN